MPYTTVEAVRSISALTETEISNSIVAEMIDWADREIESITDKVWTGQQIKELLGIQKSSTNKTFRTFYKPIVDEKGETTDDESKVTIYVDTVAQASDKFELRGAEGKIIFTTAPSIGAEIEMTYRYSMKLIQGWSTFLAAANCFHRFSKNEEKEKEFRATADELRRQVTGRTFTTTSD
jgi:hypothetical protein